jgi:hypothetical protein
MKPGWIIGVFMLLIIMQLYCGVAELDFAGAFHSGFGEQINPETGEQIDTTGTILYILSPQVPAYDNWYEAIGAFISVPFRWVWSFLNCFFFNYSFLQGGWWLFRVFLLCISVGVVVMIVMMLRGKA